MEAPTDDALKTDDLPQPSERLITAGSFIVIYASFGRKTVSISTALLFV